MSIKLRADASTEKQWSLYVYFNLIYVLVITGYGICQQRANVDIKFTLAGILDVINLEYLGPHRVNLQV